VKTRGLAKLLKFSKQLQSLPQAVRQTEEAIMRDWLKKARDGFDNETDPYRRRWAKRVHATTSLPVLTGPRKRLRNLKLARTAGHGWKITSAGKEYLKFHQKGTSRMVARRIFPDAGRLPREWRSAAQRIYRQKLREHFG
jgi:hypothetical protein